MHEDANAHIRATNRVRLETDEAMRIGQYASDTLQPSERDTVGLNASEYLGRYTTSLYNPGPAPSLTPSAADVTAHARAVVTAARPALDRIRDFWASANFTDAMLRVPWLTMTPVPADMQSIQWGRVSNSDLLGSIVNPATVIGILGFAYKIGVMILNRLRKDIFVATCRGVRHGSNGICTGTRVWVLNHLSQYALTMHRYARLLPPSMPGYYHLVCPDFVGVTPGIRPYARCQYNG